MTVRTLPRRSSLRSDIAALVNTTDTSQLPERLYELHEETMRPVLEKLADRDRELTTLHMELRRTSYMLSQVETLAAHQVQGLTRHGAAVAHLTDQVRKVRAAAQGSFDGHVPTDDLLALVTDDIPAPTAHDIQLAFYPSTEYRAGLFTTHDRAIRQTLTFIGWTVVARFAGGPIVTEPTFLVADRGALPASIISAERGMHLEMPLLPHMPAAA